MVQHLDAAWHRARKERMDPHLAVEAEERRFCLVRRYDPTGGIYHEWLSLWRRRLWDERGFRTTLGGEELQRVRRALEYFHRIRATLPPDLRNIVQYRTVADLRALIPSHVAESARKKQARELKKVAHDQSRFLFKDGAWALIELQGYVAARFWGLGTRWCTTSDEATFNSYARRSPLVVIITPRGRFQVHANRQLKDAEDNEVPPGSFNDAPQPMRELLARLM